MGGESSRPRRARRDRDLPVGLASVVLTGLLGFGATFDTQFAAVIPFGPAAVWVYVVAAVLLLGAMVVVVAVGPAGAARRGLLGGVAVLVGVVLVWLAVVAGAAFVALDPAAVVVSVLAVGFTIVFEVRILRARAGQGVAGPRTGARP